MDILERIERDHETIRELIEDVMSEFSSPEGKRNAFKRLARLVECHAKAEEAVLLERAACSDDEALRMKALECYEEHALTDEMARKTRQTIDPEAWEAKARVYCTLVDAHLKDESLASLVDRTLETQEREERGADYARLRDLGLGTEGTVFDKDVDHPGVMPASVLRLGDVIGL